ncbi:MAG: hypothetical protein O3A84_04420 [Proteobacteria bacterium]|nr:hypothetical protein [Pseudomonadota bacterium]
MFTIIKIALLAAVAVGSLYIPAAGAEPFRFIRIGDADGFGFRNTKGLVRAERGIAEPRAADTNGDGVLRQGEFLPDLNKDGGVAWFSRDEFDNRQPEESVDRNNVCKGCLSINSATRGSIWTDLALSSAAPNRNWPDEDGPRPPNNATFIFDFTVGKADIAPGSTIFFNLVFGDYDIDPAVVEVSFAKAPPRKLIPRNLQEQFSGGSFADGLIDARTSNLKFEEVFTKDANGDWRGFVRVVFVAPFEPYTAFDFVELSVFAMVRKPGDDQIVFTSVTSGPTVASSQDR